MITTTVRINENINPLKYDLPTIFISTGSLSKKAEDMMTKELKAMLFKRI